MQPGKHRPESGTPDPVNAFVDKTAVVLRGLVDGVARIANAARAWLDQAFEAIGAGSTPDLLLWSGILMLVGWLVGVFALQVADTLIHLLLAVGLCLLAIWAVLVYVI